MNWLKAKRLIRRKPYLLDPYRCRSAEEAQKILDEEGVLSPDALLSAARIRAGMSEAEWEAYTGISSEEMRRKIERLTPIRIGKVFSLSRRAAVALIIVVVLALFMACTPIGRAWAVAAYNAIVEVVDGILYIRAEAKADDVYSRAQSVDNIDTTYISFDSVDDMLKSIDEPVFYLSSADATIDSIQLVRSAILGDYIESSYSFDKGENLLIKQKWGSNLGDSITMYNDQNCTTVMLDNGIEIVGVYSPASSMFTGTAITKDTIARVFIKNIKSEDNVKGLLESLSY